jgi:hypothetical protein
VKTIRLLTGYIILGILYVLVKVIFVAGGYLHMGAIAHGAIPAVLTVLAGIMAWRAAGKGSGFAAWKRVLSILPVLSLVITPVFMYLKTGPEEWLTEGRMPVLVIYQVIALLQLLVALLVRERKE